jgi:hypothetical protein
MYFALWVLGYGKRMSLNPWFMATTEAERPLLMLLLPTGAARTNVDASAEMAKSVRP